MVIVTKIYVFCQIFLCIFTPHPLSFRAKSRNPSKKILLKRISPFRFASVEMTKKKFLIPNFFVFLQVENETNK